MTVTRGLPPAAALRAPVGALRWRPPQPVASWDGVIATDGFGPACMQGSTANAERNVSEDCA